MDLGEKGAELCTMLTKAPICEKRPLLIDVDTRLGYCISWLCDLPHYNTVLASCGYLGAINLNDGKRGGVCIKIKRRKKQIQLQLPSRDTTTTVRKRKKQKNTKRNPAKSNQTKHRK
jgi:hypothetical protein